MNQLFITMLVALVSIRSNMKRIVLATLVVVMMLSCKEDDPAPTRTQLLTSVVWHLKGVLADGVELKIELCSEDDQVTFEPDGDFQWAYNSVKCAGQGKGNGGEWELAKDDTELTLITSIEVNKFRILKFTKTVMTLEKKEDGWIYFFESVQ